jgi:hypothetical protein
LNQKRKEAGEHMNLPNEYLPLMMFLGFGIAIFVGAVAWEKYRRSVNKRRANSKETDAQYRSAVR